MKLGLIFIFFSMINSAHANRIAYFEGYGENEITSNLLTAAQHSTCTIAITNMGQTSKNYTLTVKAYSVGTSAAGTVGATDDSTANPADITPTGSGATTTFTVSRTGGTTLTAGTTEIWNFDFASIGVAPYTGSSAQETQSLYCRGSIEVSNAAAASAGFIIANGNITTFRESLGAKKLSGGQSTTGTVAYGQAAILISEGRSF